MLNSKSFTNVVENSNEEIHAGRAHFHIHECQIVAEHIIYLQAAFINLPFYFLFPSCKQRHNKLMDMGGKSFGY